MLEVGQCKVVDTIVVYQSSWRQGFNPCDQPSSRPLYLASLNITPLLCLGNVIADKMLVVLTTVDLV